ncbi:MAG: sigma-54 dependent transcriptional regulator [Gammaproteobacteria bacterium]
MSSATVLVVEDDAALREALCDTLELAGYRVIAAEDGQAALARLESGEVGMVLSDVQMRPMDGYTLLKRIKAQRADVPVVLMTAHGSIPSAVEAMHDGAADYMVKPFEAEVLISMVSRYILSPDVATEDADLVAVDARTREAAELAQRVAGSDATVLITGESGTGKEVFARFIHRHSNRASGPFVAINCAAIPENMLEAVLFGYEKGAFTGAYHAAPGKFEQAQNGTLLLDEISEMSLALQAKLLRVVQEREVERLGGQKLIPLNVRVLATSNRNLRAEVAAGRFREDLFYRLNVFPLPLPALRERKEDILPIARRLIERHSHGAYPLAVLSDEAARRLRVYAWPGNVRELDNVIQRALIMKSCAIISPADLHFETDAACTAPLISSDQETPNEEICLDDDLKSHEQLLIIEALRTAKGNRKEVAERLGISPRTLRYKLARLREAGVAIPD